MPSNPGACYKCFLPTWKSCALNRFVQNRPVQPGFLGPPTGTVWRFKKPPGLILPLSGPTGGPVRFLKQCRYWCTPIHMEKYWNNFLLANEKYFRYSATHLDMPSASHWMRESPWLEISVVSLLIEANNGVELQRCWCFTSKLQCRCCCQLHLCRQRSIGGRVGAGWWGWGNLWRKALPFVISNANNTCLLVWGQ